MAEAMDLERALAGHATALGERSITRRDEPFRLKSGVLSHTFVDLRAGHGRREIFTESGRLLVAATAGEDYDVIAGTGVDGHAVVSGVLLANKNPGLAAFWGEDEYEGPSADEDPKAGWGFRRRTHPSVDYPDGQPIMEGRHVLALEGTLTSGGTLIALAGLIRQAGGLVTAAAAVVDRSGGHLEEIAEQLGTHPVTGEPVKLYALLRLNEDQGTLEPLPLGYHVPEA